MRLNLPEKLSIYPLMGKNFFSKIPPKPVFIPRSIFTGMEMIHLLVSITYRYEE